ncbi:RacP protein [Streptomyces hygroscopicus]|uniref:RacP protein n=1 Tax=Streptomyces hygroscopicus TaxID=1912 RepID=UPI000A99EFAB
MHLVLVIGAEVELAGGEDEPAPHVGDPGGPPGVDAGVVGAILEPIEERFDLEELLLGVGVAGVVGERFAAAGPQVVADGYQLGAERAALEAYERVVLTEKLTEFRRFITGTVAPHAAAHPRDKWVKHIIAQLNSIESTLDLVVSS